MMATIVHKPLVRCDNCGATDEMHQKGDKFVAPDRWGGVRVSPTTTGMYPNNIAMSDLCPACLKKVHAAVTDALADARKEQTDVGTI